MRQRAKKSKVSGAAQVPLSPQSEIPEFEQWRIIKDSGVLDSVASSRLEDSEVPDRADELFNAILFIIPFSSLYLMMDILIQRQYGKHPPVHDYVGRLASAVPVLSLLIFYTIRHKAKRSTQLGLFTMSLAAGIRLIWLVNRAPWHIIIRQGPPLATLWIFAIAVLDLPPAIFGLFLVTTWVWWTEMKLVL